MKYECKTAFILLDGDDLKDFKDSYGYPVSEETLLVPFSFTTIMQVVLYEQKDTYYIPCVSDDQDDFFLAKIVYEKSQKFLKQLLLTNKVVDESEDSFPLELFWFHIWSGIYRVISLCYDFIDRYSIEEVILIKRNKFINSGGLLINTASFIGLIENIFKSKNIKVKIFEHRKCYVKPKTIFYAQTHNLKSLLKLSMNFLSWKMMSFNKKNYDYILISPMYDNVINYCKSFKNSAKTSPQIFHGGQMPFLHSWSKSVCFWAAKTLFNHRYSNNDYSINSYKTDLCDFEFDFTDLFRETVAQYLSDVKWMKSYIDLFWQKCLKKGKGFLVIFSLPLVHLHSYFLIKKTKDNGGKIAVWQHGGLYGYVDHFQHYISDYKNADYFLSFGKSNIKEVAKGIGDKLPACIEVGSNVIYGKLTSKDVKPIKLWNSQGLFIPVVVTTLYSQVNIKWRGDLYFDSLKQIVDYFGSDEIDKIMIKGLKNHASHRELRRYINVNKYKNIFYTDISIDKALSNNPKFVIIDNSSTPLLQVLAQYAGPIFLTVNQESCSITEDALNLLKRRVVYSESIDELKIQLADFFKTGTLECVDMEDTSFVDVYLKRFCCQDYEHFLQEAMSICR